MGLTRAGRIDAYRRFFARCHAWLPDGGRLALQTITKGNNMRLDRAMTRDLLFIIDRIFPESELPWTSEVIEASERRFDLVSVRNDPQHTRARASAGSRRCARNRGVVVAGRATVSPTTSATCARPSRASRAATRAGADGLRARVTATTTLARAPGATRHAIYWRDTEPVEPGPPLEGERRCDVCIVGGGYTGMWTAHFLKLAEPALDIQIVEADYAGAGASGHNDGFVTPTIGHSLHTVVKGFGPERAKAGYAAIGRSILELRRFCRKQGVDAELEPNGFYLVATDDGQRRRLDGDVALAGELGVAYEVLDAREAQERIGSPAIRRRCGPRARSSTRTGWRAGLCRVVREQGVEVHEGTPALTLERAGGRHAVTTPRGRLVADRLVLATNAYQHRCGRFATTSSRSGAMPPSASR